MFIAMNRFRVAKGSEAAFEHVWMSRDSHLEKVPVCVPKTLSRVLER
jgi:heme-degrading monooxygenase HmoA